MAKSDRCRPSRRRSSRAGRASDRTPTFLASITNPTQPTMGIPSCSAPLRAPASSRMASTPGCCKAHVKTAASPAWTWTTTSGVATGSPVRRSKISKPALARIMTGEAQLPRAWPNSRLIPSRLTSGAKVGRSRALAPRCRWETVPPSPVPQPPGNRHMSARPAGPPGWWRVRPGCTARRPPPNATSAPGPSRLTTAYSAPRQEHQALCWP